MLMGRVYRTESEALGDLAPSRGIAVLFLEQDDEFKDRGLAVGKVGFHGQSELPPPDDPESLLLDELDEPES